MPFDSPSIPNQTARLHVTPFNPTLLNVIVPPSILPSAKHISYHSLQTFPEKSYGFLELPTMDAEKIKKKLNGSILKGSRIRIEEARPSKEPAKAIEVAEAIQEERKAEVGKGSRKRKRHDEILPGVELRDRKVQRGWTTPAIESRKSDKRRKDKQDKKASLNKSKFTSQPECLFKTSLPPNVAGNLKEDSGLKLQRKRSSKSGKEFVVVHEFSKTTKHATFLRGSGVSAGSTSVSSYVEGTGWVDKDGNVVEAEVPKRKRQTLAIPSIDAKSSNEVSSSALEDSSHDEENEIQDPEIKAPLSVTRNASGTSSSGSSSEDEEQEDDEEVKGGEEDSTSNSDSDSKSASEMSQPSERQSRPETASSMPPNLSLQIPNFETTPVQVHPLEALYKKSNIDDKAIIATPTFSFFNNDINEDIDNPQSDSRNLVIPMTPFTQQEFEVRGLRSAAPTPDTAYPGKSYVIWPNTSTSKSKSKLNKGNDNDNDDDDDDDDEEEEEEEEEEDDDDREEYSKSPIPSRATSSFNNPKATDEKPAGESDFQKWFYENRGEANRAWKKRRKVVSKEKRHRENKKRGGGGAV